MTEQEEFSSIPPVSRAGVFQFSMQSLLTLTAAVAVTLGVVTSWDALDCVVIGIGGATFLYAAAITAGNGDSRTASYLRTVGTFVVALAVLGAIRIAVHLVTGPRLD